MLYENYYVYNYLVQLFALKFVVVVDNEALFEEEDADEEVSDSFSFKKQL